MGWMSAAPPKTHVETTQPSWRRGGCGIVEGDWRRSWGQSHLLEDSVPYPSPEPLEMRWGFYGTFGDSQGHPGHAQGLLNCTWEGLEAMKCWGSNPGTNLHANSLVLTCHDWDRAEVTVMSLLKDWAPTVLCSWVAQLIMTAACFAVKGLDLRNHRQEYYSWKNKTQSRKVLDMRSNSESYSIRIKGHICLHQGLVLGLSLCPQLQHLY